MEVLTNNQLKTIKMETQKTLLKSKDSKAITYGELRELLNYLPEDKMNMPVRWWGEDRGGSLMYVVELMDDYINASGEGLEPKSVYAEDETFDVEDEPVVLPKGSIILEMD